jgi:hypothetical protein
MCAVLLFCEQAEAITELLQDTLISKNTSLQGTDVFFPRYHHHHHHHHFEGLRTIAMCMSVRPLP